MIVDIITIFVYMVSLYPFIVKVVLGPSRYELAEIQLSVNTVYLLNYTVDDLDEDDGEVEILVEFVYRLRLLHLYAFFLCDSDMF